MKAHRVQDGRQQQPETPERSLAPGGFPWEGGVQAGEGEGGVQAEE